MQRYLLCRTGPYKRVESLYSPTVLRVCVFAYLLVRETYFERMDDAVRSRSPMPIDPLLLLVSKGPSLDFLDVRLWSRHVGGDLRSSYLARLLGN